MAWGPILAAMAVGAAVASIVGWRVNLHNLEEQIQDKRVALKKLTVSGGIPPTQEVMDYLASRRTALEQRYGHLVQAATAPPLADAARVDPQLYFQEQLHEVQRILERLAAARGIPAPEQLGFPKELPPSDTVPRLLVQLSLMRELAELILEQGIPSLSSLKVEDPETVSDEEDAGAFLIRLPVRVRFTGSLPHVLKVLGAIHRANPLIDARMLRILPTSLQSGSLPAAPSTQPNPPASTGQGRGNGVTRAGTKTPDSNQLEVEFLLARYLIVTEASEPDSAETTGMASAVSKARQVTVKPERP